MKKQMMLDFAIFCFPGLYVCIEELACLSLSTWLLSGMCYLVHINICCNLFCNNYYWSIFFCNHQCSSYWYWTFNRPFFLFFNYQFDVSLCELLQKFSFELLLKFCMVFLVSYLNLWDLIFPMKTKFTLNFFFLPRFFPTLCNLIEWI